MPSFAARWWQQPDQFDWLTSYLHARGLHLATRRLMAVPEVAAIIESGWSFKFNCALVAIDFMVRHGLIGPDHPDYLEICRGLRR